MIKFIFFIIILCLFPCNAAASTAQFIPAREEIDRGVYMTLESFKDGIYLLNIFDHGIDEDILGISMDVIYDKHDVRLINSIDHFIGEVNKVIVLNKEFKDGLSLTISSISDQTLIFDDNLILSLEIETTGINTSFDIENLVIMDADGNIKKDLQGLGGKIEVKSSLPISGLDQYSVYIVFILMIVILILFMRKNSKDNSYKTSEVYYDLASNLVTKKPPDTGKPF